MTGQLELDLGAQTNESNKYKKVSKGFSYNSGTNTNFLSLKELSQIVKKYSL